MNGKTYGVKITAITDGFTKKMNDIKNLARKASENIKKSFSANKTTTIKTGINESMESDIVKIQELKSTIRTLKSEMRNITPGTTAFKSYAIAIDEAEKELKELMIALKEAGIETEGFRVVNKKLKSIPQLFKDMAKKVTRYGIALLGIRGIITMVSRATSAYLSYDIELAEKLRAVWAGLGAFLAPIIEKIANFLMKLVGYLNIFIKAVTGQDLLAKAGKKATENIKKETSAVKGLNKALSGLDEITNIQDDTATGGNLELDNPFKEYEGLELPWADKIREFGEDVRENWPIVVGYMASFASILGGIELILKGGTFAKFGKILFYVGIMIFGVVGAIQMLKDYLELTDKGLENSKEGWRKFWDIINFVGIAIVALGLLISSTPLAVAGAIVGILSILGKFWPEVSGWIKDKMDKVYKFLTEKTGLLGDVMITPFFDMLSVVLDILDGLFKGVKQLFDGIIKMCKGDIKGGLKLAVKGLANVVIGVLNGLISELNAMLVPFRTIITAFLKVSGKKVTLAQVRIPKIPLLDVGTNYVPEDQLAYIHKGEAVVPKKFNSAEYFDRGTNNNDVKELLVETNRLLGKIEEKDNNTYLDGKEIGKSTVDYIRKQSRILGRSVV